MLVDWIPSPGQGGCGVGAATSLRRAQPKGAAFCAADEGKTASEGRARNTEIYARRGATGFAAEALRNRAKSGRVPQKCLQQCAGFQIGKEAA